MAGLTWFEIKESCDFGSSVFGKQEGTKMLLFVMGQKKLTAKNISSPNLLIRKLAVPLILKAKCSQSIVNALHHSEKAVFY